MNTKDSSSKAKTFTFWHFVISMLIAWCLFQGLGAIQYTLKLAEFHDLDWQDPKVTLTFNGTASFGAIDSILKLKAIPPASGSGSNEQWCPGFSSKKNHLTIAYARGASVCCWAANEQQWFIPHKETKTHHQYLCGKWPHLDEVSYPKSLTNVAGIDLINGR